MANFERALMDKLDQVLAQDCPVCATRVETCHHCKRPVGGTGRDRDHARLMLDRLLNSLKERLDRSSWLDIAAEDSEEE